MLRFGSLILVVVLTSVSNLLLAAAPIINVSFSPQQGVQTRITAQNNSLVAVTGGKQQVLLKDLNRIPGYARDIWVADFNFDRQKDVAITSRTEADGEDHFYSVFSWNPRQNLYIKIPFIGHLSNLEIIPSRQEIRSSYLSGDYWTEETYRFSNNLPYIYSRSILVAVDVWHTSVFDPNGRLLRSIVSEDGRIEQPPNPVITTIKVTRAPIYHQPVPSTISQQILTIDEVVTILDFRISHNGLAWTLIRTELDGGGTVRGWTPIDNLAFQ